MQQIVNESLSIKLQKMCPKCNIPHNQLYEVVNGSRYFVCIECFNQFKKRITPSECLTQKQIPASNHWSDYLSEYIFNFSGIKIK